MPRGSNESGAPSREDRVVESVAVEITAHEYRYRSVRRPAQNVSLFDASRLGINLPVNGYAIISSKIPTISLQVHDHAMPSLPRPQEGGCAGGEKRAPRSNPTDYYQMVMCSTFAVTIHYPVNERMSVLVLTVVVLAGISAVAYADKSVASVSIPPLYFLPLALSALVHPPISVIRLSIRSSIAAGCSQLTQSLA